ncbi:TetR/AcrR family transcriptional regulator [Nonomuraea sp. NPDC050556]|uniref:TetR/AcrR family transcriptional regulator n=1 Tax=Nonomuraea sp. NPDC050556 TaxID=3364369 RepID=UPI00379CE6E5
MTETPERRRAPGMSPDQRRAMIVAAALPLVAEHGAAITTSQVARAAGIGEATIFRVFTDKDELLGACVIEAMNPDHVLRELASIPLGEPLADRLVQAAEALRAHLERMGTVIGALHASGLRRDRSRGDRPSPGSRESSMKATHEAVTELIEPDRATLRLEPGKLASIFLGTLSMGRHPMTGEADVALPDLIDILLHGALRAPGSTA